MEYVQERITTLHDLPGGGSPPAFGVSDRDISRTAVIVPMTAREHGNPATERVLDELASLEPAPGAVYAPVRAGPDEIEPFREWLDAYSLPLSVLWCNAPGVQSLLDDAGLANGFGKGRDVWLALGPATAGADGPERANDHEYVVVHDADASSYEASHVERLLAPLTMGEGFEFSKAYYARVEGDRLYGRLFRLFYEPLLETLSARHDEPIVGYLDSFRYALAGEFAGTTGLLRRLDVPRAWGLEVGTLGAVFDHAGFSGTAQVDLGRHEHDHRTVSGEAGLEGMSHEVAAELLRVLERRGVDVDYETLPDRYYEAGERLVDRYAADATFNGLEHDADAEREQVSRYAESIVVPGTDRRLPPWVDSPLAPEAVLRAAKPWRE